MPTVDFREIPGYPGYFASNDGRIWSDRRGSRRELAKYVEEINGYRREKTNLYGRPGAKVATLVCEAFYGPRPDGCEVAHLNGDSLDNRAENLAWKTTAENHADKVLHGTAIRGARHKLAKLTDDDVHEIRRLAEARTPQRDIAVRFGITQPTVSRIVNGTRWGWLSPLSG